MTRSQRPAPKVGIVYLVGDKLWIDSTPLTEAGRFGDFAIHERDHISNTGRNSSAVGPFPTPSMRNTLGAAWRTT